MADQDLTVVVPTRDRPEHLDACLSALAGSVRPDDEVLVVDSASRGGGTATVARDHGVGYVRVDRPGTSRARNAGAREAGRSLLAFVDDDVRVTTGWADALARALTSTDATFATGRVEVPPGQEGSERPVAVTERLTAGRLDASTRGVLGASANLGIRRAALAEVGGFDERLGPGTWFSAAEDVELFDRLFAAGHHGWFEPAALAYHDQWRDRRALVRLDYGYGKGAGARLVQLLRTDPGRARAVAAETLWHGGLVPLAGDLARGYQFGALTLAARLWGTFVGGIAAPFRLRERP